MIYSLLESLPGVGGQVDTPLCDVEDARVFLSRGVKWPEPEGRFKESG